MKKDTSLSDEIFSANNKSKNYIELYDLEIKLKKAIKRLKDKIVQVEDGIALIDPKAVDKIFGDKLTK